MESLIDEKRQLDKQSLISRESLVRDTAVETRATPRTLGGGIAHPVCLGRWIDFELIPLHSPGYPFADRHVRISTIKQRNWHERNK